MKAIGGYFGLELDKKNVYHADAISLNTGRNAFEYILITNAYKKVYLPFFTCDVLLEPLQKHNIDIEFYRIDEKMEPIFDYSKINDDDSFLYTNYFGLKDEFIKKLAPTCKNLIVDNSQSFFSKQIGKVATFYSCRKFFGVPDGAYLYNDKFIDLDIERDVSYDRCMHLLQRIDISAEEGYENFAVNDRKLSNQSIKGMSALTTSILSSIDYEKCAVIRRANFNYLYKKLNKANKLFIDINLIEGVPMVFPFWSSDKMLRKSLLSNKIYTATYWPNVLEWCDRDSLEYKMASEVVYLPIDQRYGCEEIDIILKIIK